VLDGATVDFADSKRVNMGKCGERREGADVAADTEASAGSVTDAGARG
jgi:hypothetical protein